MPKILLWRNHISHQLLQILGVCVSHLYYSPLVTVGHWAVWQLQEGLCLSSWYCTWPWPVTYHNGFLCCVPGSLYSPGKPPLTLRSHNVTVGSPSATTSSMIKVPLEAGNKATSPSWLPNVESSSCRYQAARKFHLQPVQKWIATRG